MSVENGTYGTLRWFAEVLKVDAVLDAISATKTRPLTCGLG